MALLKGLRHKGETFVTVSVFQQDYSAQLCFVHIEWPPSVHILGRVSAMVASYTPTTLLDEQKSVLILTMIVKNYNVITNAAHSLVMPHGSLLFAHLSPWPSP